MDYYTPSGGSSMQNWDGHESSTQPRRTGRAGGEGGHRYPAYIFTGKLEIALSRASHKAREYERQMKELEARLSENLANFRAIDGLIQETHTGLQHCTRRAERACETQVPHIYSELDESAQGSQA
ncbi:hypothetical protein H0H81_010785 [Sphagnurus paluster]|uniref:Uncharacterized protein n=1 Tax=Sphagnurus paluster TaxID=117069 RepID=A0A9P7K741_9AGAR|nr:hypothetical protein H0H81_010785 [Sphagnurus paluster]